jgi:hypothetical protein
MRSIAGSIALLALTLTLAACVSKPMESAVLREAVEQDRRDMDAVAACESSLGGPYELVAAIDSTSGELVELAGDVNTLGDWDSALPPNPYNYIAICVYDIKGTDFLRGNPDFMAYWVGEGDNTGGAVLFTAWATEEASP